MASGVKSQVIYYGTHDGSSESPKFVKSKITVYRHVWRTSHGKNEVFKGLGWGFLGVRKSLVRSEVGNRCCPKPALLIGLLGLSLRPRAQRGLAYQILFLNNFQKKFILNPEVVDTSHKLRFFLSLHNFKLSQLRYTLEY